MSKTPLPGEGALQLSPQEAERVVAACEAFRQAWLANDAEAVMATLTPEAVIVPHHGVPPQAGARAIRDFWWPAGGPPSAVLDFTQTVDETGGSGELAYARGRFHVRYRYEDAGGTVTVANDGNYLQLLQRQADGGWRICHRIWNDAPNEAA